MIVLKQQQQQQQQNTFYLLVLALTIIPICLMMILPFSNKYAGNRFVAIIEQDLRMIYIYVFLNHEALQNQYHTSVVPNVPSIYSPREIFVFRTECVDKSPNHLILILSLKKKKKKMFCSPQASHHHFSIQAVSTSSLSYDHPLRLLMLIFINRKCCFMPLI